MSNVNRQGVVTVVEVDQPLRQDEADLISLQLDELESSGVPRIVVDLSQTPLIDGAGLQWLEDLDWRASDLGGSVRLCGANELCGDILWMTGLNDRLERFETLSDAMASFVR